MTQVLYVDPEGRMASCLSHIFGRYGGIVLHPVASGEDALAWLSEHRADVIVSEYDLPGMDGVALLDSVKGQRIPAPFIIFTERDDDAARKEAYSRDVFGYIVRRGAEKKPILKLLRLIYWAAGVRDADELIGAGEQGPG